MPPDNVFRSIKVFVMLTVTGFVVLAVTNQWITVDQDKVGSLLRCHQSARLR